MSIITQWRKMYFFSVADHLFTEKEALIVSVINSLSITAELSQPGAILRQLSLQIGDQ